MVRVAAPIDGYDHMDAYVIEDGKILDYITGKPVAENDKERVRQRIARALFHEYGISVDDMEPDFKLKVDGRNKKVDIAIFEAGFDQYDSKLVYTDLYEAQAFYEQGDSVTGVEMRVDDIERAAAIAKQVTAILDDGVYHTMDWRELNHGLFTALLIQQIVMSVVLTLIIVIAAFTVIATLIMVVLDKRKEIALLKALGARDAAILRVFLYQGGIIGFVGTALGLGLGYAACKALLAYGFPLDPKVYFISKLPVNVRPTEFLITGAVAIVICLIATIFPALHAARLRPSDGLRAE